MQFTGSSKEYFEILTIDQDNCSILKDAPQSSLTILWFISGDNVMVIDGRTMSFEKDQIIFLTEFHKVHPEKISGIRMIRFNRSFYCILDHDREVGCKGILFFGASQLPILDIPDGEKEKLEVFWNMLEIEMQSRDHLQIDMLQMMLKRYLILSTRWYKAQNTLVSDGKHTNLIREFNFLVEQHFRTLHSVSDYAKLLHKSPKTLSNIFSKLGDKTPLQYIQDRKILEARRLLRFSDHQVQEIAYDLGYQDVQAFSRFFKKHEGMAPSEYRNVETG